MTLKTFRIRVVIAYEYEVEAENEDHAYEQYQAGNYDEVDDNLQELDIEEK